MVKRLNVLKIKKHVIHVTTAAAGLISSDLSNVVGAGLLHLSFATKRENEEDEPEVVEEIIENEEHIHDACQSDEHENHLFI